jgi:hypothetical protein
VAAVETKQGLYKEYTIDRVDDSYLDEARSGYKTAEQTEENKTKVSYYCEYCNVVNLGIPIQCFYSIGHCLLCY